MKSKFSIGVVAEGHTDQLVIRELVNAYMAKIHEIPCQIEFKDFQPNQDRTSGSKEGGWAMVYKWCLQNTTEIRESTYFGQGLFANELDKFTCDALLIHMDSDICEKIGNKSNVTPVPTSNSTPDERGKFIKQVIEGWLWDSDKRHGIYIISPAVESTETWLAVGLAEDLADPESVQDIQRILAELDYEIIKRKVAPKGISKPSKSVKNYKNIVNFASPNVSRIYNQCGHFKSMIDEIIQATTTLRV